MDEQEQKPQEQQNEDKKESFDIAHDRQQEVNQIAPTPLLSPPSHKRLIIGIVAVFVLFVVGGVGSYFYLFPKENNVVVACTDEAKVCLDGSVVGRVGSNCEFAECPNEQLSDNIFFDKEAKNLCGAEPPVLCQKGMKLGCNLSDKKWRCFQFSEEIDTSVVDSIPLATGWKTYRNEKYEYEIKYPSDWQRESGYTEPEEIAFWVGQFIGDVRSTYAQFSVSAREVSKDFIDMWNISITSGVGEVIEIDNVKTSVSSEITPEGRRSKKYIFISGNNFYGIETVVWDEDNVSSQERESLQWYENLLEQIVTTFKFIEPQSTTPPNNLTETLGLRLLDVTLNIEAPFSTATLTIKVDGLVHYNAKTTKGSFKEDVNAGTFSDTQMKFLAKLMEESNFFSMESIFDDDGPVISDGSFYTIKVKAVRSGPENIYEDAFTHEVTCYQFLCTQGFMDIKDKIIEFWGQEVMEIGV